jgi:Raf kinase inhibitor-like YbhB/YbcL family protein
MGHRRRALLLPAAVVVLSASCASHPAGSGAADALAEQPVDPVITVMSDAFGEGEPIPPEFTCDAEETSPPLSWAGVPDDAVELAVVVDDPDARGGTYVHWILFGLQPSVTELGPSEVPAGARQAKNSAGDARYKGPCPPGGRHQYRFSVYALGEPTGSADGADPGEVLGRIQEAAIAKGTLSGTYER